MAKERERSERRLEKRMPQQIVTRHFARWIAGTFLALCPLMSHALGLGKLDVKSALNQPLDAEIDFTSITQSELKGLNVSLAPRADFEAAGAERLPLLSQIKFIVSKRPDGRYYLKLKTDAPIEEPFLHMLLQVEWAGGRLVREYTALIDPPSYIAAKPSAVESPRAAPPVAAPITQPLAKVETVPPPTPSESESQTQIATPAPPMAEPLATARPIEPQPAPHAGETQEVAIPTPSSGSQQVAAAGQGSDWANTVEYTVRPGDTLWSIAQRIRVDKRLSLEQVILAIFRNNPDAFFRNNVNNVYAGKVLKIPERDAVEASPIREARREFRVQYSAWKEYKLQLAERSQKLKVDAEPAESAPPPAKQTETQEAKQESTAKADKSASTADETGKQSEELLKIVRATGDSKDQSAGKKSAETESAKSADSRERTALAERVTTLDESLESKRLENRELTEKVGQVRSQIKNEKRLIQLENQALAEQTAKPEPAKPEMAKPDAAAKTEPAAPAPMPEKKAEAAAKPSPKPATPPAKAVKAAPRRPVRPPPAPAPQKGLVATVMDMVLDPSLLPVIGGVIVLGGAILLLYMRRRRRSIAEFEESILASDAIASEAAPTTSAEATTGQVTTGDTSFLSDFSKTGMGQVHTDEVDPVAEAEVYLAYGRDETAEEILKEAIVKNPERHELKQKLLEIYHQRNDVNAFETLAEELYASVGGRGGKIWEKVEEMGRKLNPENPMFRGGAPDRRTADASAATMPASGGEMAAAGAMGASAATQVVDAPPSVDFNFDAGESDMSTDSSSVEFDLNTEDMAPESPPEEKPVESAAGAGLDELEGLTLDTPADNVIDFQSEKVNASAASESISFEADTAPAADGDEIKWEIDSAETAAPATIAADATETERKPESGNGADEHWDETATKLDLAKAYIDMGDAEGARSILDEVLAEGNDQQKKQAAELAAQIA